MSTDTETCDESTPFTYLGHTFGFSIADVRSADLDKEATRRRFQAGGVEFVVGIVIGRAWDTVSGSPPPATVEDFLSNQFGKMYEESENAVFKAAEAGDIEAKEINIRLGILKHMAESITLGTFAPIKLEDGQTKEVITSKEALNTYNTVMDAILSPYAVEIVRDVIAFPDKESEKKRRSSIPDPGDYTVRTSSEFIAMEEAAADGSHGNSWDNSNYSLTRYHQRPGSSYRVDLGLTEAEESAGLSMNDLEKFTYSIDADTVIALHYIAHQIAPPPGVAVPKNMSPGGLVHIESVAEVIDPNYIYLPPKVRESLRRKAWEAILFGTRARVVGERSIKYYRPKTREVIDTKVSSAPWVVSDEVRPMQMALFGEVPEAVYLVVSRQWLPLFTDPVLAQHLPMGEKIGSIPGGKPAGSWARVMGLTLAGFFRRHPRETLSGKIMITRRELLLSLPPKVGDVIAMLHSKDSKRAISAYANGLGLLVDRGLIAPEGEAVPGRASERLDESGEYLSGAGWQERWLNTKVQILPGIEWLSLVQDRAAALPVSKPRFLGPHVKKPKAAKTTDS